MCIYYKVGMEHKTEPK